MNKITLKTEFRVLLNGKHVGQIRGIYNVNLVVGWQYFPKGSKNGGEKFTSLEACKASLF